MKHPSCCLNHYCSWSFMYVCMMYFTRFTKLRILFIYFYTLIIAVWLTQGHMPPPWCLSYFLFLEKKFLYNHCGINLNFMEDKIHLLDPRGPGKEEVKFLGWAWRSLWNWSSLVTLLWCIWTSHSAFQGCGCSLVYSWQYRVINYSIDRKRYFD